MFYREYKLVRYQNKTILVLVAVQKSIKAFKFGIYYILCYAFIAIESTK